MDKPIISYVIPCYNCESTIFETILSIKETHEIQRKSKKLPSQWKDIEVIAVNDGSNDFTLDILNELSNQYPNIKVIDLKENKGKGIARNAGNKEASSDIIGVLDSDDWHIADRTTEIINIFNKKPECSIFYSAFKTLNISNNEINDNPIMSFTPKLLWETGFFFMCHSTIAYKKQTILDCPYSEDKNKDDWSMLWNFFIKDYKFCYSDNFLVLYRIEQKKMNEELKKEKVDKLIDKKHKIMTNYFLEKQLIEETQNGLRWKEKRHEETDEQKDEKRNEQEIEKEIK